jgi:DNA-binding transcriptional ArsR family regulator
MDTMDPTEAIAALAALAQASRLEAFRLLVNREPEGIAAGDLARQLAIPQNTMSAHLAVLARADLVRGERRSRSIIYRADIKRLGELMLFLANDCCGGRPDLCAPLVANLSPCCLPKASARV